MADFNERFTEYTTDMGIDASAGAQILGIDEKTFYAYQGRKKTKRSPTLAGLRSMAYTFAVTSDWLTGDAPYPKWRDDVSRMRLWLRTQVFSLPAEFIEQERIVAAVQLITDRLPQAKPDWFMPGILGLSLERYAIMMRNEGDISTPMVERFSAFSGLPKDWIRLGDTESLTKITAGEIDPAWVAVVDQYKAYGHQPEDHLRFGPAIGDLVDQQKQRANI